MTQHSTVSAPLNATRQLGIMVVNERLKIELAPISDTVIARAPRHSSISLSYVQGTQCLISPAVGGNSVVSEPGRTTVSNFGSGSAIGEHVGDLFIGPGGKVSSNAGPAGGIDLSQLSRPALRGITLYMPSNTLVIIVSAGRVNISRAARAGLRIHYSR